MSKISGFTFFSSYHESLKDLESEDRRELLEAIVFYVFDDIEPELTGFKKTIWTLIVPNLTTSKNKSKNAQKEPKKNQKKIKSKSKSNQNQNNVLHDKEEDKGIGKEIEEEKEDNSSNTIRSIYAKIEENFGRPLSPIEYEKINSWSDDYTEDIIEYAVQKSVLINKRNFMYVEGILRNWKSNGWRTLQEIKDEEYRIHNRPSIHEREIFDFNWLEDTDE